MFEPRERVVVAVSGGPDSVVLLYCLNQLNIELCLNFCVAHLDHQLRKESRSDGLFVKKLAQSLNIPFFIQPIIVIILPELIILAKGKKEKNNSKAEDSDDDLGMQETFEENFIDGPEEEEPDKEY